MVYKNYIFCFKLSLFSVSMSFHCNKFHLISWYDNFAERHSLCIVSDDSLKTMRKCAFPQNYHTRKVAEITVFFAVITERIIQNYSLQGFNISQGIITLGSLN